MDRNADRDDNGTDQPRTYADERETYADERETYWRRRAATLAAGLGLLGLLAWAFSGGGGKPAGTAARDSPAFGALSVPAASSAPPSSPAPSISASATAGADAAVPGLAPAASTGRCSPGAVVLSLFGGSRSYPAGQNPEFGVDAVSTAPGICTFDLSPAQLHLVVMSAGRVIWDSADCAHGGGSPLTRLSRGVPVREYFTWNRAITLPGCVTLASSARPGSYAAQAKTPAIASGVFSFLLAR